MMRIVIHLSFPTLVYMLLLLIKSFPYAVLPGKTQNRAVTNLDVFSVFYQTKTRSDNIEARVPHPRFLINIPPD